MKITELEGLFLPVFGDFNDLNVFGFQGVYILYDPNQNDEVVYVGNAYTQGIKKRLSQYTKVNTKGSGNTLAQDILKTDYNVDKYENATEKQKQEVKNYIMTLKIVGIPYIDLETQLIKEYAPKYNEKSK